MNDFLHQRADGIRIVAASLALLAGPMAAGDEGPALAELPEIVAAEAEIPVAPTTPTSKEGPASAEIPEGDGIAAGDRVLLLVTGAAGEAQYAKSFAEWADRWSAAARRGGMQVVRIPAEESSAAPGSSGGRISDREGLRQALSSLRKNGDEELWVVLIGHGTDDGRTARFNLNGPDLSDVDLAAWLKPFSRPVAVINTSSSSGPFAEKLARDDRVLITATRSGSEVNATRFGHFLSSAVAGLDADLDQDGQTSLLEAWLMAARKTTESYAAEGRLATEHSQLDDDGDGHPTRPDSYRGIHAITSGFELVQPDGALAHQFHLVPSDELSRFPPAARHRCREIELEIQALRGRKRDVAEAEYWRQLEALCVEMARLYERHAPPLRTAEGDRRPAAQ